MSNPIAALTSSPIRVLAVESDGAVCEQLRQLLTFAGHTVRCVPDATQALRALADDAVDVILADAGAAGPDGMTALLGTPAQQSGIALVLGGVDDARGRIAALRQGAQDWLARPYDTDELLPVLERAAHTAFRARELASLRAVLGGHAESVLIGRSPAMQRLRELVQRAAGSRSTVVIVGESGTGKELVARTIHAMSDASRGPCLLVECTGRDAASLEAELFGATGDDSHSGMRGALARASGGTVILDDATALPPALQTRLLRVLQERALGGATGAAEFRLLVTVREERAPQGAQPPRYDLLGRAGVFTIAIPPLRDRRSDIPLLASHFRERFARDTGSPAPALAPDVVASLIGYEWPGNVRQLEHYVGRLMLMAPGARTSFDSPSPSLGPNASPPSLVEAARAAHWTLDDLEREYITRVLDEERGHQSRAAQLLGIDRRTLYRKLKQYKARDTVRGAGSAPKAAERSA